MKILLFWYLILLSPVALLADEPPDWQAFLIHSANNQWTADVYPEGKSPEPSEDKWRLQIYNKKLHKLPGAEDKLIWFTEFRPTGILKDFYRIMVLFLLKSTFGTNINSLW